MKVYRLWGLLLLVGVIFVVTGCQSSTALETYEAAVAKTDAITKGATDFEMQFEYQDESVNWPMAFNMSGVFEDSHEKMIYSGNVYFDDLGKDFTFYKEGDKQYLYLDMLGKYIAVSGDMFESQAESSASLSNSEDLSEFFTEIGGVMTSLLNEENVFKGEKVLMDNPDGEVKATKYTVSLTDAQKSQLMSNIHSVYKKNKEVLLDSLAQNVTVDRETMAEAVEGFLTNAQLEKLSVVSYVDYDGYIITSDVSVGLIREDASVTISWHETHSQIEQDVYLDFPIITKEMILSDEDMTDYFGEEN